MPPPSYLSTHDFELLLADTLVDTAGVHDIRIHRIFATQAEERMLRTAESLYPLSARVTGDSGATIDRWWFSEFDGIKIDNYATRGALAYYLDTIRRFQGGDFMGTIAMQSSGLNFRSSIEWTDYIAAGDVGYRDVYAATIVLDWYQVCGSLCAMGFSRQRTVIFNAQGDVIRLVDPKYVGYWIS
ncbi:MAG: hypothetical protein AAB011_12965 [Candidatus Eisenbacteria bacterium]